ncbi:hypothetical protein MH122_14255 [Bacillus pumilus]|uniref:hypothetical protein n=1 Tax=Bacillus pumilus TaxID=1408 RepID=UPI0022831A56|nr:hypothetical protein [Bacillus pumilus]MCY7679962.1 hypothetical protein [Bacillus pumilus]
MNISSTNIIQGRISSAGDDNKSNYVFTLELEKKVLHIYDSLDHKSTSALNCVNSVVETLSSELNLKKNGIAKVLIYTETDETLANGYKNRGSALTIHAYDLKNNEFVEWVHDDLYQFYYDTEVASYDFI